MENLNLSVQINQGDGNLNWQGKMDPAVEAALARLKATWDKAKEKKRKGLSHRCTPCTRQIATGATRALVKRGNSAPLHPNKIFLYKKQ